MNKRQFLKTSGAFIAASVLPGSAGGEEAATPRTNWAGNYAYKARRVDLPRTVEEVQEIVKRRSRVKALGARHAFNSVADTTGDQISLKYLNQMVIDPQSRTVTVGGGVTYSELGPYLDGHGFALHNLASLPHISVPGACATATHGSGNKNGNLATAVSAMEIVTADGKVRTLSSERDGDQFRACVVHLGALGVVTEITLRVLPTFQVRQVVYENLSIDRLEKHLDEIFASGYSVSLFTDWQNHRITQVWIKSRVEPGSPFAMAPEFYGAKRATRNLHPITGHSAESCTQQLGIPGPWYDRLPHFRINAVPSSGHELQTEYFVPRERGYEAILAVEQLRDRITPLLFVTELRTIDADDLWMSTCYQRPSMTVHFTWKPDWPAVRNLLPAIEEKLAPFNPRPHWAKVFTLPPSRFQPLYEKLPDYRALLERLRSRRKVSQRVSESQYFRRLRASLAQKAPAQSCELFKRTQVKGVKMENKSGGRFGPRLSRRDLLESTTGIVGAAMMLPDANALGQGTRPEGVAGGLSISSVQATVHEVPVQVPLLGRALKTQLVFVEVNTDEGVTGFGLTGDLQAFGVRELVNRQLGPFLKGKSPLDTEARWQEMFLTFNPRYQTGVWSSAVSAIDIALWDIKGKHYNSPVWRLLGGAKKKTPAYITFGLLDYDRDQLVEMARRFVAGGQDKFKMVVAIDNGENPLEDVARVKAVREAIGEKYDLMIDGNYLFSQQRALELAKHIEPYNLTWFEEPLYGNDARLLAELRQRCAVPISAGQNEGSRFRHLELLQHGAVDILQPNVCYVGGYTEGMKVAALAQAYNVLIADGGGWPHHNMHLQAGVSNGWRVEFHYLMWKTGEIIFKNPPGPEKGFVMLTEEPGLGLEPNREALKEYLVS